MCVYVYKKSSFTVVHGSETLGERVNNNQLATG